MSTAPQPVPSAEHLFLDRLPDLVRYAGRTFRGPQRDEAVAEAVAAGYLIFRSLDRRGRAHIVGGTGFLFNAVRCVFNDRHVGGRSSSRDAMSKLAQRRRGFKVESLSLGQSREECLASLIESRRMGPAELAAFKIDFGNWLSSLSSRDRRIMARLASGDSAKAVARSFQLSNARISQLRSLWHWQWAAYQGEAQACPSGLPR